MSYIESELVLGRFSGHVLTLASAGVYAAATLLLGRFSLMGGGFVVQLSDGLAFPLGILFGLPGAVGVGLGVVVSDAAQSTLGLGTVAATLSTVTLAYGGRLLWRRSGIQYSTLNAPGSLTDWSKPVVAGVVACLLAAGVAAWLTELLGLFPFYASFAVTVVSFTVATLLVLPALLAFVHWVNADSELLRVPVSTPRSTVSGSFLTVAVATSSWVVLSSVASLGFTIREKVPLIAFERYGVTPLYEYVHPDLFGHGGRRAQVLFGAVVLALLYARLRTDRVAEGR